MQGRNPRRQCVRALSSGCAPHRLRRWAVRHITLTLTCKIIALLLAEYWRRSHRLSTLKLIIRWPVWWLCLEWSCRVCSHGCCALHLQLNSVACVRVLVPALVSAVPATCLHRA